MKTDKPTKKVFCANEQEVTEQTVDYVNGEHLLTCSCKRILKFPGTFTKDQLSKALAKHEEVNKDQVSQAELDKEKEEKLKLILDA